MNPLRVFLTLFAVAASVFGLVFSLRPTPGVEILKAAFPALLLGSTFAGKLPQTRKLVFIRLGLAFCVPADFVLGQLGSRPFFLGMGLFGVGYTLYFLSTQPGKAFPALAFGLGMFSVVQLFFLGTQDFFAYLALVPYLLIITLMTGGGWSEYLARPSPASLLAALGFTFLYLSDSMIGHDQFGPHRFFGTLPILLTYLVGQTLVTLSNQDGAP